MATNWIIETLATAVSETGTKTANLADGNNFNITDSTGSGIMFKVLNDESDTNSRGDFYSLQLWGHTSQTVGGVVYPSSSSAKLYLVANQNHAAEDAWLWEVADGGTMYWKHRTSGTTVEAGAVTDGTCDTTSGDATVTMDSTASIAAGWTVSGTGITEGTTVSSITNSTTFELSANATASNTNTTLTFTPYGTTGLTLDTSGNLTTKGGVVIGSDVDGTDRSITFGHSTLKTIMGIDDDQDVFAINTDAAFESANDFELDASGNATIKGDLTVSGGDIYGITDGALTLRADTNMFFDVDNDNDGAQLWYWRNGSDANMMTLNELGALAVTGTLDVGGASVNLGANSYMTLTEQEIDVSNGDLTIDVAGDITLDADGGDIIFKDNTLQFMHIGSGTNVAIGAYAGNALGTTDLKSIAIGKNSLKNENAAEGNIAIGHDAMRVCNDDGANYNIAIGFEAMENCTDLGAYNIAIGFQALDTDGVDASNNVAIGSDAMGAGGVEGNSQVAIGHNSLYNLSTGTGNICVSCSSTKII